MNIIYISSLIPPAFLDEILSKFGGNYVVAPNKFHHTIVEGFIENGHKVKAISHLPEQTKYIDYMQEDEIEYYFIKYSAKSKLKHLQIAIGVYRCIRNIIKEGFIPDVLICDVLNVSICLGALFAGKKFKVKTVGIVTDLLGVSEHEEKSILHRIAAKISNSYSKYFGYYVLLTQQMNDIVNPKKRPYIIMEGICDCKNAVPLGNKEIKCRRLFYAGGRPSKDGVNILISAFKRLPYKDVELHIYGNMPNQIKGRDETDKRIFYHGIVDNNTIVQEERTSYLLINPRPTGELYTLYSFPSKVMEYMVTGVPMVTTKLSGIPEEYFNYVFSFEESSEQCYFETLLHILSIPNSILLEKGNSAQKFVLNRKNKIVQTARIIELIKS